MNVLLTGGAGFIGTNLTKALLEDNRVSLLRVLDNFSTGYKKNIALYINHPKYEIIEGSISNYDTCVEAVKEMNIVCHQAALGSVPRSIADPIATNEANISGTLNLYTAAKNAGIRRIVYAASSSTYGDSSILPKKEDIIGKPLSPYAVTKYVMELYAHVFSNIYKIEMIGLRYFNVFGPYQNPKGAYAAVIPLFINALIAQKSPVINGDGSYSRDFTYIDNVVQANIHALFTDNRDAVNNVYNIAYGESTSLLQLFSYIKKISGNDIEPTFSTFREGDVAHSLADISKARHLLKYNPLISIKEGLQKTYEWYNNNPNHFDP